MRNKYNVLKLQSVTNFDFIDNVVIQYIQNIQTHFSAFRKHKKY